MTQVQPQITTMGYGFLVAISNEQGDHRFSFVKKEGAEDTFELGPYSGPFEQNPQRRWRVEEQAKLAMLSRGHTLVV